MHRRKSRAADDRVRDSNYVEDDTFYEAFPRIKHASLGSLESFALRRMDGLDSEDDEDSSDEDDDQPESNARLGRRHSSVYSRRASTVSHRRGSRAPAPRKKSKKKDQGKQYYAQHRNEAMKKAMYSGVTHSDMDVQTGRPPLMYQMGLVQWLWFQSTTKQRVTFLMIGFLLAIVIIDIIVAFVFFSGPSSIINPYLCTTKNCESLAKRIKSKLNRSVNPCDDFYAFVCGSSGVQDKLSERDEKYWTYGFDEGNIVYDFDYSPSLGSMLKPTKTFPESLVLTMYKGCLEERERQKAGLQPFYDVLKELNLYDISLSKTLTPDHVIDSMARILSHSFTESAILSVKYYFDEDDQSIKSYVEPATILQSFLRGGAVHRHGYRLYHDTIKAALLLVKDELKITDAEMVMLPHDLICLDLYLLDQNIVEDADSLDYLEKIFGKQDFTHEGCDMGIHHTNVIEANFGQAGMKVPLDGAALINKLRELGTPSGKLSRLSNADPLLNDRSAKWFLPAVQEIWKASSALRLMRYFQWRILYDMSFELNKEMIEVMRGIRRYSFSGLVTNCFHNLFRWLPFVAPNRFFQQIPEERLNEIENQFEDLTHRLQATYDAMTARSSFGNIEKLLNMSQKLTKKQRILFQHTILHYSNTDEVSPVLFKAKNFPTYRELYKDIKLVERDHVKNIITMGRRINEWRINPDFFQAFWDIDPVYHTAILVNQLKTVYDATQHSVRNYIPIGSVEVPFFRDGLAVSDASGIGLILGGAQERGFILLLRSHMANSDRHLKEKMASKGYTDAEVEESKLRLEEYIQRLKKQIQNDLSKWTIENINWGDIRDLSALNHLLDAVLMDEGRYEAVAWMVSNYLKDHKKEAKYVLRGLEDFNAKKLYYITLVNRRCEKLGRNKFNFITQFGPLSQSVRNNIQLSYQDDFSRTFSCPLHSKMNPIDKVYFHDRNLSISSEDVEHLSEGETNENFKIREDNNNY